MQNDSNETDPIRIKVRKTLLEEYFVYELRDIYGAEQQLQNAMVRWKGEAISPDLAGAIEEHISDTEQHIARLQIVFDMMGEEARPKKCEAIEGIIHEADHALAEAKSRSATHDVALVMAIQKAEHYEIATYGGLITLARTIGQDDVANILKYTMAEEKEMDELLSGLAETNINEEASTESANL